MNDFDEIKSRINITEAISRITHQQTKRVGADWIDLAECPFCGHHDCFRINESRSTFNCYSCNECGSIIDFYQKYYSLGTAYGALKKAAEDIDYELTNSQEFKVKSEAVASREKVFRLAMEYYHGFLMKCPDALKHLKKSRGFDRSVAEKYKLGATHSTDRSALHKHLNQAGITLEDQLKSGLVRDEKADKQTGTRRKVSPFDFLPASVYVYPHFVKNHVSHFTFKDPNKVLRYQLPNTFKLHGHLFYGQDARYADEVILVEGENDRISIEVASGKNNVIAILGQLSEPQRAWLKKNLRGKTVYLCMDTDDAGRKYTRKLTMDLTTSTRLMAIPLDDNFNDIDEYLAAQPDPEEPWQVLHRESKDALQEAILNLPETEEVIQIGRALEEWYPVLAEIEALQLSGYMKIIQKKYPGINPKAVQSEIEKRRDAALVKKFEELENLPSEGTQIFEKGNCYFKRGSAIKKLSNFVLKIQRIHMIADEVHYDVILRNKEGNVSHPITLAPEERTKIDTFQTRLAGQGSYWFYGNKFDLFAMWATEEEACDMKELVYSVQQYGYLAKHDLWLFGNCAVTSDKQIVEPDPQGIFQVGKKGFIPKDVLVYSGDTPTMNTDNINDQVIHEIVQHFHGVVDTDPAGAIKSYRAYLLLGFIVATVYMPEIAKEYKLFPFPFAYGPSGTGKSATLALLMNFFGWDGRSEPWNSATPDGLFKFMEQVSSMPAWMDEFMNNKGGRALKMLGITKNIYNRIGAGKGGLKNRQVNIVRGALWLSGEDTPVDEGLLSRCVVIRFAELNEHKNPHYEWLQEHSHLFSSIVIRLIKEKTSKTTDELLKHIEFLKRTLIKMGGNSRTAINYCVPVAAFELLGYKSNLAEFHNWIADEAKEDLNRKEDENILVKFFDMLVYMTTKGITEHTVRYDVMEEHLYVAFSELIKDWRKEGTRQGNAEWLKENTIRDYISKSPYFMDETRVKFTNGRKRAMKLNVKMMPHKIKEMVEELQVDL